MAIIEFAAEICIKNKGGNIEKNEDRGFKQEEINDTRWSIQDRRLGTISIGEDARTI